MEKALKYDTLGHYVKLPGGGNVNSERIYFQYSIKIQSYRSFHAFLICQLTLSDQD